MRFEEWLDWHNSRNFWIHSAEFKHIKDIQNRVCKKAKTTMYTLHNYKLRGSIGIKMIARLMAATYDEELKITDVYNTKKGRYVNISEIMPLVLECRKSFQNEYLNKIADDVLGEILRISDERNRQKCPPNLLLDSLIKK